MMTGLADNAGSSNKDSMNTVPSTTPAPKPTKRDPPEQFALNVNVTGPWSLDLMDQIPRHLDLALVQNKEVVLGSGAIDGPNGAQRVTASGSFLGGRLSLTAMPLAA